MAHVDQGIFKELKKDYREKVEEAKALLKNDFDKKDEFKGDLVRLDAFLDEADDLYRDLGHIADRIDGMLDMIRLEMPEKEEAWKKRRDHAREWRHELQRCANKAAPSPGDDLTRGERDHLRGLKILKGDY